MTTTATRSVVVTFAEPRTFETPAYAVGDKEGSRCWAFPGYQLSGIEPYYGRISIVDPDACGPVHRFNEDDLMRFEVILDPDYPHDQR